MTDLKTSVYRGLYRFQNWRAWRAPSVRREVDDHVRLGEPPIPAQVYRGSAAAERVLLVYFHGGGWVIGDLQTHHAYCRALSAASGASLIAVDYRRAPEHCFPAAQDDCLAATRAIAARQEEFGASRGGLILAGDSAGGHLALCTALAAEPTLRARLQALVLTYPVLDHYSASYPSYEECATGQGLTRALMRWFWDSYLGDSDPRAETTRRAFPIRSAALGELPPTLLCTAGRDPLRDEGLALVEALRRADVATDYEHYPDAEHGFACSMGPGADYRHWLQRCAGWIAEH